MDSKEFYNQMADALWGHCETCERAMVTRAKQLVETEKEYNLITNKDKIVKEINMAIDGIKHLIVRI